MKMTSIHMVWVGLFLLSVGLAACAPQVTAPVAAQAPAAAATQAPASATYTDPFAYCSAVGTIDAPDARYTGVAVPETVVNGYKKAAGLQDSTEPMDMLQKTTSWRCADGQVYACNVGANLPCSSKANTDKTPTQGMTDFCAANPSSEFIPMSVTGHDTVYNWGCKDGKPEALDQFAKVDAQGYIADIWYPIGN